MSSLTTRLKLLKPTPSETVDVSSALDANFDLLDGLVPNTACTAAARPALPFDGQFIWETDTGIIRVWNATLARWLQFGQKYLLSTDARPSNALVGDTLFETDTAIVRRWNGTRFKPVGAGNIYESVSNGGDFNINANPQVGISALIFTVDGFTPYQFEYFAPGWYVTAAAADNNALTVNLQESTNGGGAWTTILTLIHRLGHSTNAFPNGPIILRHKFTPTAGARQYRINCAVSNTNATMNSSAIQPQTLRIQEQ